MRRRWTVRPIGADLQPFPESPDSKPGGWSGRAARRWRRLIVGLGILAVFLGPGLDSAGAKPAPRSPLSIGDHDLPLVTVVLVFDLRSLDRSFSPWDLDVLKAVWSAGDIRFGEGDRLGSAIQGTGSVLEFGSEEGAFSLTVVSLAGRYREVVPVIERFLERSWPDSAASLRQIQKQSADADAGNAALNLVFRDLLRGATDPDDLARIPEQDGTLRLQRLRQLHDAVARAARRACGVGGSLAGSTAADLSRKFSYRLAATDDGPESHPAEAMAVHSPSGTYLLERPGIECDMRIGQLFDPVEEGSIEDARLQLFTYSLGYGWVYLQAREAGLSFGSTIYSASEPGLSSINGLGSCAPDKVGPLLALLQRAMTDSAVSFVDDDQLARSRLFWLGAEGRRLERLQDRLRSAALDHLRSSGIPRRGPFRAALQNASLEEVRSAGRMAFSRPSTRVILVAGPREPILEAMRTLGLPPPVIIPSRH